MDDSTPGRRLARTAFSISGVLPLGAFLAIHVVFWSLAAPRPELARRWSGALWLGASLLFVWLPLLYHSGYGFACWLGLAAAPNAATGLRRSLRFTGVLSLTFVLAHGLELVLPFWAGSIAALDLHARLCDALASTGAGGIPWRAALYLAGTAATAAHFGAGLCAMCLRWSRLRRCLSERGVRLLATVLATTLFATAARAILYFATGGLG